jgi:hypothetical protein
LYNTTASTNNLAGTLTTNGPSNTNLTTLNADANTQNAVGLIYIINTNGTTGSATVGNASAYAIYGKLTAPSTATYFCIDSTGQTNPAAIAHATSTCPVAGS